MVARLVRDQEVACSNPVTSTIKTHAKGAYKTPLRVSFSMQSKGKLPFLLQFTLVVSSRITLETYSSSPISSFSALNISDNYLLSVSSSGF